jgi:hypothetical protein
MQKSKPSSHNTPNPDYSSLRMQLGDYTSTFYGPSNCQGCGKSDVVRKAFEQGAESWETREAQPYVPHHCSHVLLFRKLTGRVLTVIDAAFPPTSSQLKAIKDLLKRDFADAVAEARMLEGEGSSPSEEKDPVGSNF